MDNNKYQENELGKSKRQHSGIQDTIIHRLMFDFQPQNNKKQLLIVAQDNSLIYQCKINNHIISDTQELVNALLKKEFIILSKKNDQMKLKALGLHLDFNNQDLITPYKEPIMENQKSPILIFFNKYCLLILLLILCLTIAISIAYFALKNKQFLFNNGDIYVGEWKDNKIQGQGILLMKNKTQYEGHWINNKKDGKGRLTQEFYFSKKCHIIYEGYWKKDKKSGYGIYFYPNGSIYKGNWHNDKRVGQGKFTDYGKFYFDGVWKDDQFYMGNISITLAKNYHYEGQWLNGQPDGKGKYFFSDIGTYEGQFKEGKKQGTGIMIYTNGQRYEGSWKHDVYHGHGLLTDEYQNLYEGNFKDGKFHGQGKYRWNSGSYYIGNWQNGIKKGQGQFVHSNGDKYTGGVSDKHFDGHGVYIWANGEKYEGDITMNKKNGKGTYFYSNGETQNSYWNEDNKVRRLFSIFNRNNIEQVMQKME